MSEATFTTSAPQPAPPAPSLWDVVVGIGELGTVAEALEELDEGGRHLKAAATLRAIGRLRRALEAVPAEASGHDPVVLRCVDACLLARLLLEKVA